MRVGLFIPCFVDLLYPEVGVATTVLLERLGIEVDFPPEQTCCGQAHFNAGRLDEARPLARRFAEIFEAFEMVVCPSGSCTAMVRAHYRRLIGDCAVANRTFELCEFLSSVLGEVRLGARLTGRAALHVGCHGLRELRAGEHARRLLEEVEGLSLVATQSDEWCCGFGGTFAVKFSAVSSAMGARKLAAVREADVDYLVSTDSSCLMHLGGLLERGRDRRPRLLHVAEVLAGTEGLP